MPDANQQTPLNAPVELLTGNTRWICADATGKPIPGTAAADPAHWVSFDEAYQRLETGADSMGIALTNRWTRDPWTLIVIDLDSCFTGDTLDGWAAGLVAKFDTYVERSQSGKGLHIFVWSERGDYSHNKRYVEGLVAAEGKAPQVQIFGGIDGSNYVRVTGDRLPGYPGTIQKMRDIDFVNAMFPAAKSKEMAEHVSAPYVATEFTEAELTERLRDRLGRDASLIDGDWQTTRSKSASEAYFRLVIEGIKAAGGDGELVLRWLLDPTQNAWARGQVESTDPGKYAKESWVENRVKKATGSLTRERPLWADMLAEASPDEEPDEEPAVEEKPDALFLPVGNFRRLFNTRAAFLIENLLPRQGVVQIYGQPGSGKSLWALSLAYAISTGAERWFGLPVEDHGAVLVLVGEDPSGVAGRTEAQEKLLGLDVAPDLYLSREPLDITHAGSFQTLAKAASAITPKLIIVDTQIANAGDLDENNTQEMSRFIKRCEALAQVRDCLILLVHHQTKSGKGGARGSSVQAGAVIANFQATMNGSTVQLRPVKTKNWKRLPQLKADIQTEEAGPPSKTGQRARYPVLDSNVGPDWSAEPEAPEAEDKEPELAQGQLQLDPARELRLLSLERGRLQRSSVVEHLTKLGIMDKSGSTDQLRRLELKLQQGGLKVDSTRGKNGGVVYE